MIFSDFSSDDFNSSDESIFSDASESDDEHIHDKIQGTRRISSILLAVTHSLWIIHLAVDPVPLIRCGINRPVRVQKFIWGENCKNEERLVRMKNSANDLMTECEQLNVDING